MDRPDSGQCLLECHEDSGGPGRGGEDGHLRSVKFRAGVIFPSNVHEMASGFTIVIRCVKSFLFLSGH